MRRLKIHFKRFLLEKILHATDSPHTIALGVLIATIIAILPIIGFQTVVALFLAALFRANKAVCIPIVWISNPLTAVPIYYPAFLIGHALVPSTGDRTASEVLHQLTGAGMAGSMLSSGFWYNMFLTLVDLGIEIWIGSAVIGLVLGVIGYFLTRWGISAYRDRQHARVLQRARRLAILNEAILIPLKEFS